MACNEVHMFWQLINVIKLAFYLLFDKEKQQQIQIEWKLTWMDTSAVLDYHEISCTFIAECIKSFHIEFRIVLHAHGKCGASSVDTEAHFYSRLMSVVCVLYNTPTFTLLSIMKRCWTKAKICLPIKNSTPSFSSPTHCSRHHQCWALSSTCFVHSFALPFRISCVLPKLIISIENFSKLLAMSTYFVCTVCSLQKFYFSHSTAFFEYRLQMF